MSRLSDENLKVFYFFKLLPFANLGIENSLSRYLENYCYFFFRV